MFACVLYSMKFENANGLLEFGAALKFNSFYMTLRPFFWLPISFSIKSVADSLKKLHLLKPMFRNAACENCFVYLSASFEMTRELLYLYLVIYSMVMYTCAFVIRKLDNAGA